MLDNGTRQLIARRAPATRTVREYSSGGWPLWPAESCAVANCCLTTCVSCWLRHHGQSSSAIHLEEDDELQMDVVA